MPHQNLLKALSLLPTTLVSDAIETFNIKLKNEGHTNGDIVNRFSDSEAMIGYALTIKMRTDPPPFRGTISKERQDWWDVFSSFENPKIIVIEDVSEDSVGSVLGKVHGSIFKAFGAAGVVTNGAVRNVEDFSEMNLPLYSGSVCPSHSYARIIEIGAPVIIGGLKINNGDLLHGDKNGVVKIPAEIVEELPAAAQKILKHQQNIIDLCNSSHFSTDKLRRMLNVFEQIRDKK